ncbi:29006_t:CDS:1, partial [Racocetra persica]
RKYIDNLIDEEIFNDKIKFDKVLYIKPSFATTVNHKKKCARLGETCKNDYLKKIYMEYESRVNEIYPDHIIFDNENFLCKNCRELRECVYYNKHYQLCLENPCNLSRYIQFFNQLIQ